MPALARPISAASTAAAPSAGRHGAAKPDPRRRVLDAAALCFIRSGFHGTSMQEICAEAGMSPGALYRYFPSKDAIIVAIVEEERAMRASFVEGLTRMGRAVFSGENEMVCLKLGPEIFAEAARNPALKPTFDAVEDEMNEAIRRCFIAAQARGEIDASIDPDIALLLINAIGDGLMLRSSFEPDLPLGNMMPALAGLMARMLAPTASSDATP